MYFYNYTIISYIFKLFFFFFLTLQLFLFAVSQRETNRKKVTVYIELKIRIYQKSCKDLTWWEVNQTVLAVGLFGIFYFYFQILNNSQPKKGQATSLFSDKTLEEAYSFDSSHYIRSNLRLYWYLYSTYCIILNNSLPPNIQSIQISSIKQICSKI